MEHLAPK